jgi:hypothetical protein
MYSDAEGAPVLFRGRHFQDRVIVLCVRWYLRYCLSLRDLEELMVERGLAVDHSTIGRWLLSVRAGAAQAHSPRDPLTESVLEVDETYVSLAGIWTYLSGRRFHGRDDRLHAVDQTGCCRRQALPAHGLMANRADPAA